MYLHDNIRLIRKKWGENQEEFSARLGMTRSNLSKLESGELELSLANCRLLSKLTGVTIDRLLDVQLDSDEIPVLPIGEGGEKLQGKAASAKEEDLGEFADLRNLAAAVREMQNDVGRLKKLLTYVEDTETGKLKVFNALQVIIGFLEEGLEEGDYLADKKAYLNRLAELLTKGGL